MSGPAPMSGPARMGPPALMSSAASDPSLAPDGSPAVWSDQKRSDFRLALLAFFDTQSRNLPWRADSDPYRVLVSEFMLQQTRVDTVIPYFERWMERFPDAASLAAAEQEEVLGEWQGLGYYSRARNLHRAVREVEERWDGHFPSDPDVLRSLPGVGRYTSGAVASIAFGAVVPAVDGNVRRVMARLADAPAPSAGELDEWTGSLVDPLRPGDFNQALMELGATVCTPRSPDCVECPVSAFCMSRIAGSQEARPTPKRVRPIPSFDEGVAVLVRAGEVLFERLPEEGLLGGMWSLPGAVAENGEEPRSAALRRAVALGATLQTESTVRSLPPELHVFSHRRVRYHPFLIGVESEAIPTLNVSSLTDERALRWITPGRALAGLPLPAAQRRMVEGIEVLLACPAGPERDFLSTG